MGQSQFTSAAEDFSYGAAQESAALKLSVSVFADRAHIREQWRDDAQAIGFRIAETTGLAALNAGHDRVLGDVILLDCPSADGATLAALAGLDMRAARADAKLVVSTNLAALNDVFGCLDQSRPQILVDPGRAERLLALGQLVAYLPGTRVQELSEGDRLVLLRLTERVNQIAERMEFLGGPDGTRKQDGQGIDAAAAPPASPSAFSFSPTPGVASAGDDVEPAGAAGPDQPLDPGSSLPQPKLVRRMIRQRQLRARFFDGDLFADPAWDMLLDLTAARAEQSRVSVTSLCIASGVPPTTALRWIGQMTDAGLLQRNEDKTDRRRAFITLSDKAADAMTRFFAQLGDTAPRLV